MTDSAKRYSDTNHSIRTDGNCRPQRQKKAIAFNRLKTGQNAVADCRTLFLSNKEKRLLRAHSAIF